MGRYAIDWADILAAQQRLSGRVHRTPVMTSRALDRLSGRQLFFKCENLQRSGSFKLRGAMNAVYALEGGAAERPVVTHSSGNHAQALALAASIRGIGCHVAMPNNSNRLKRLAVLEYGGQVHLCEATQAAREAAAQSLVARFGGELVPPFESPSVIAGQGTCALELLEQAPGLDALICPVGGGGLLSGNAFSTTEINPGVLVFGAEPLAVDDAARSKARGERVVNERPMSIADGLLTNLGELPWPIVRDRVEAIITVAEEAILEALRQVFIRMKLVIEPSAAVAVAAALSGQLPSSARRVGVILSGGNIDLSQPWFQQLMSG